jgi:hypothetical protein
VFGKITTRHVLLFETRYWEAKGYPPEAWGLDHDFTEYIAAPGADVREMIPVISARTTRSCTCGKGGPSDVCPPRHCAACAGCISR